LERYLTILVNMSGLMVLCVDDDAIIAESIRQELKHSIQDAMIETALSGEEAMSLLDEIERQGNELAILITDERMPGMRGHELLKQVRQRRPNVYGILLTGYADLDAIGIAVNDAGLFRFMQKPWNRIDLAIAVRRALDLYRREREVTVLRAELERVNLAFVALLENPQLGKDPDTIDHVKRVACYAALIGKRLGLPDLEVRRLFMYTPLHDIGKYTVPQRILAKPGRLDPEEFEAVKQHVAEGDRMLGNVDIDPMARNIILYHHERWDGNGYLAGLQGLGIPREARIVALADVLDAMVSIRPYKSARPFDEVASELVGARGSHFDPGVIDAFTQDLDLHRSVSAGAIPLEFDFAQRA
jgi:putative two-component system response regulator